MRAAHFSELLVDYNLETVFYYDMIITNIATQNTFKRRTDANIAAIKYRLMSLRTQGVTYGL